MNDLQSHADTLDELAEEFIARYRQGERPAVSEFAARCPERAAEILDLFPALVVMEQVVSEGTADYRRDAAAEREQEHLLQQLGDFRVIREIGRGGMGVVYEAEQVSLDRRVALKVLPQSLISEGKHARRFEREARAAAKLHHTNIVPVFGIGQQNGLHYYVMQFIDGQGLDRVLVELQRLREASAAERAQSQATVEPLAAIEPVLAQTAARNPVSAHEVAHSLVSGWFQNTVIADADSRTGDDSGSAVVNSPRHSLALNTLPLTSSPASDTAINRLSDTHTGSSGFALPGQADGSGKHHSRSTYWHSVARIGMQAAEALQYAHDQGIIHRDIKPANLLLDLRGTIWVTDFGLAKAADQQDLTRTGDVLGTLRYMAPEAFEGQTDPRSDVYSLGLTLYELLALKPAFDEADRRKLIKQVTTGTPARLRLLDSHIPRDLETIVHKAIERDPVHRYATAQDLADDLRRYLGDEPVRARRISPVQRFTRWCRRNPAGAAVVALLVVGMCGSITAAALFAQERNRTNDALADSLEKSRQLTRQNDVLDQERRRADEERQRAEKEQQRAEDNHRRAREAVDRLLTKVAQDLEDTPQMEQIRRALLEDALEFYQVFLEQKGRDPTIRYETGLAYLRVADIERQLSRAPASLQHYDEATKIFRELAVEFPTRAEYREQLAHCDLRRGTALSRMYRYDAAAQAYERSLQAWDTLAGERPDHPVCLEELARVTSELGGFWSRRYYFTKGQAYLQRANALLAQLARDFPNYPVDPSVKLKVPDLLRATASARGEPPQAIRHNQPQYFWLLPHDPETLIRYDQEARKLLLHWEQLTEAHPDVPDYQKAFHQAAMDYSRVLMAQDRFDECERLSIRLLVDINRLVAKHPDVPEYRVGQMWNEFELGQLQYLVGKHAEALEHYRTSIDTAGALTIQYPNEPRFLIHLGGMLIHCADPRFRDGERATQALRRALQITDNPAEWVNLGRAQMLAGHDDEAQKSYAHARKLGVVDARVHLGEAFLRVRQGRLDEAQKSYALGTDWLNNTPNTIWYLPACRSLRTEFEALLREKEAAMPAGDSKEPMPMGEPDHPRP